MTRVTAGLGVCVPKKSLYSRGVVMMSKCVAALMKEGKERRGSRSKSSPAPSSKSFFAYARSCGSSAWAEKADGWGGEDQPRDAQIVRIGLIPAHTRPAGAVSHQCHPTVSLLCSKPNPCGDITRILAGDTPITATTHALSR